MALADLGTKAKEWYSGLKECIGQDGKVLEGMESTFSEYKELLNPYLEMNISTDDSGNVTLDGVSYETLTGFDDAFNEKAQKCTITEYFTDDRLYYCGVLTNELSSAEALAKALCSACDGLVAETFQTTGDYTDYIKIGFGNYSSSFSIVIYRANNGNRAKIQLGAATMPGVLAETIDILGENASTVSTGLNIAYFIHIGRTGDFYLKCYYTSSTTAPAFEDAEESFKDISMNAYDVYSYDDQGTERYRVSHMSRLGGYNWGGFAVVEMENITNIDDTRWDVVLFSAVGSPLVVGITNDALTSKDLNNYDASPMFYRAVTNATEQISCNAPIYSPGSDPYVSKNSQWGLVSVKDGYYEISDGAYMGHHAIYDHGFVLTVD